MMKDWDDLMLVNNIPCVVESGTLLGAVRNGGIILRDDDLDVNVPEAHVSSILKFRPTFEKWGYQLSKFNFVTNYIFLRRTCP